MEPRICPLCGEIVPDDALDCPFCGAPCPSPRADLFEDAGREREGPSRQTAPPKRPRRRRRVVAILCALAVLAGAVGLALWRMAPEVRPGPYAPNGEDGAVFFRHSDETVYGVVLNPSVSCVVSGDGVVTLEEPDGCAVEQVGRSPDWSRILFRRTVAGTSTGMRYEIYSDASGAEDDAPELGYLLYDRGELLAEAGWREAVLSGDGSVVFYTAARAAGDGEVLMRRDLDSGEPDEQIVETDGTFLLMSAGWQGSSLVYMENTGTGVSARLFTLWTREKSWSFAGATVRTYGSEGVVIRQKVGDLTVSSFSSATSYAWPGEGELDFHPIPGSYLVSRDGSELLYQDEAGDWWWETARERTPVALPEGVSWLYSLVPQGCGGSSETLADWVYIYITEDGETGLLRLEPDLTVRVLTRGKQGELSSWYIDREGRRLLYMNSHELYLIEDPRTAQDPTPRLLTDRARRVYPSPDLEDVYYICADRLYYLSGSGEPVEVSDTCYDAVTLAGGGCFFRGEGRQVWYSHRGGKAVYAQARYCDSFIQLSATTALALGYDADGAVLFRRLDPSGTVETVGSVEGPPPASGDWSTIPLGTADG